VIPYRFIKNIINRASWDNAYHEELQNFHEIGDEGEIW